MKEMEATCGSCSFRFPLMTHSTVKFSISVSSENLNTDLANEDRHHIVWVVLIR
jgi:hypothetical protein